jgi:hypothetical protein
MKIFAPASMHFAIFSRVHHARQPPRASENIFLNICLHPFNGCYYLTREPEPA